MNNVPLGAENDPRAPWNERQMCSISIDVSYDQLLTKTCSIEVDQYADAGEYDEEGNFYHDTHVNNSEMLNAFYTQHYNPLALIDKLKTICEKLLEGAVFTNTELKDIIRECEGWEEVEESIE